MKRKCDQKRLQVNAVINAENESTIILVNVRGQKYILLKCTQKYILWYI